MIVADARGQTVELTLQLPPTGPPTGGHHDVVSRERLLIFSRPCDFADVKRQSTIRRLLAIAVIAGLVLAPLSRPVMAGSASDASMPAMADDTSMAATADQFAVPCCPTKAPTPSDCDKCVFMAACKNICFGGQLIVFDAFAAAGQIVPLRNDFRSDGLGHPPPEYPPRTLA
ncbi:MAG TPA: hypothetical protein VGM00_08580 [Bradyrhizobium sp.]|jgi:hypothetical protein